MKSCRKYVGGMLVVLHVLSVFPLAALAQSPMDEPSYRVAAGDKLVISVPQRPDLNREAVIDNAGTIILPLVGAISVAGLTANDIEVKLLRALRDFYPSVDEVRISVVASDQFGVYVVGEVDKTGKYSFTTAPNLWDAIREAGGPTGDASLDFVRIVQDASKGGSTTVVNVARALELGTVDTLPQLKGGDTVIIPKRQEKYQGSFGVNVFGEVLSPGTYRLGENQNLMGALLQAGGPTKRASLTKVTIIRPEPGGSMYTMTVDLDRYLETGDPVSNPELRPGDTVNVPSGNTLWYFLTNEPTFLLSAVTAVLSIAILVSVDRN